MTMSSRNFYAVAVGSSTGVFTSWRAARAATNRVPGARFRRFDTAEDAQRFLEDECDNGSTSDSFTDEDANDGEWVYAVAVGRCTGIYEDWADAMDQTRGYSGASVKKFPSYEAAAAFLGRHQWREDPRMKYYRESTGFLRNSDAVERSGRREVFRLTQFAHADSTGPVYQVRSRKRGREEDRDVELHRPAQVRRVEEDPDPEDPTTLVAFCDGSVLGNGQHGSRGGVACIFPHRRDWDVVLTMSDPHPTNSRAEWLAVLEALKCVKNKSRDRKQPLIIYSDSDYVVKSMTKHVHYWLEHGWHKTNGKPVLHVDLIQRALEWSRLLRVIWRHVHAHTNGQGWLSMWNDEADRAARGAAHGDGARD